MSVWRTDNVAIVSPLNRWRTVIEATGKLRLRAAEAAVLHCLAYRDGGKGAWPSVATMAREANLSRASVKRALRSLERSGVVVRDGVHGPPGRQTFVYRFNASEALEVRGFTSEPGSPVTGEGAHQ